MDNNINITDRRYIWNLQRMCDFDVNEIEVYSKDRIKSIAFDHGSRDCINFRGNKNIDSPVTDFNEDAIRSFLESANNNEIVKFANYTPENARLSLRNNVLQDTNFTFGQIEGLDPLALISIWFQSSIFLPVLHQPSYANDEVTIEEKRILVQEGYDEESYIQEKKRDIQKMHEVGLLYLKGYLEGFFHGLFRYIRRERPRTTFNNSRFFHIVFNHYEIINNNTIFQMILYRSDKYPFNREKQFPFELLLR